MPDPIQTSKSALLAAQNLMQTISSNMGSAQSVAGKRQEFYVHSLKGSGTSSSGFSGVSGNLIQHISEVGNAQQDDNPMHAVAGAGGYFVVDGGFTRIGTFGFDKEGACINHLDQKLLTYQLNEKGQKIDPKNPGTVITDTSTQTYMTNPNKYQIRMDAKATDSIDFAFQVPEQGIAVGATFSTDINVNDSFGTLHSLRVTFKRAAFAGGLITPPAGGAVQADIHTATAWYVTIAHTTGVAGDTIGADYTGANGVLVEFDSSGKPIAFNNTAAAGAVANGLNAAPALTAEWGNHAADSTIDFDMTQVFNRGRNPQVGNIVINGNSDGTFQSMAWDEKGNGTVIFSNGQQRKMFQLAMARFNDENSLLYNSNGTYSPSAGSGEAKYGTPGDGMIGTITPGAVEQSTVSTTDEQIKIMEVQRYHAGQLSIIKATKEMAQALDNSLG